MAGIRALTNIGEGAAQVFDTSELIAAENEKKAKNEEKIIASMLDYDPNDVWQRDIPKISADVDKYENWVMENYDRLTSGGKDRIAAWTEKKNLENGLRNTIAYSKKAGSDIQQLSKMIQTDPDYDTEENRALVANFMNTPKDEDYNTREAFNTTGIQEQFVRSMNLPLGGLAKVASDSFYSPFEMKTTGQKGIADKRMLNDKAGFDAFVDNIWQNGDTRDAKFTAEKIRAKYKTKEALASAIDALVPRNVDTTFVNPKTGTVKSADNKKFVPYEQGKTGVKFGVTGTELGTKPTAFKPRWIGKDKKIDIPADQEIKEDAEGNKYVVFGDKQVPVVYEETQTIDKINEYYPSVVDGMAIEPIAFPVSGIIGGVNTNDGSYSANLFGTSSKLIVSDILLADKALKQVYAKYPGEDAEGNAKTYMKPINPNEIIPEGATLYSDVNYSTPIQNRAEFIQTDLYAAVQGNTPTTKPKMESEYQRQVSFEGGSTFAKGLVKYSDVEQYVTMAFPHYPGLQDQVNKLKSSKPVPGKSKWEANRVPAAK